LCPFVAKSFPQLKIKNLRLKTTSAFCLLCSVFCILLKISVKPCRVGSLPHHFVCIISIFSVFSVSSVAIIYPFNPRLISWCLLPFAFPVRSALFFYLFPSIRYLLYAVRFYEARPVKLKICLIGSTFYPGFHVPPMAVFISWSQLTYTMTPILNGEL